MSRLCCDKAVFKDKTKSIDGVLRDTYVCSDCKKVIYLYDNKEDNKYIPNHSTR